MARSKYLSVPKSKKFREVLLDYMQLSGVSKVRLAEVLGCKRNTVQRMFASDNKDKRIKVEYLNKVSKEFNITKDKFVSNVPPKGTGIDIHTRRVQDSKTLRELRKNIHSMGEVISNYLIFYLGNKMKFSLRSDMQGWPRYMWWSISVGTSSYIFLLDLTEQSLAPKRKPLSSDSKSKFINCYSGKLVDSEESYLVDSIVSDFVDNSSNATVCHRLMSSGKLTSETMTKLNQMALRRFYQLIAAQNDDNYIPARTK